MEIINGDVLVSNALSKLNINLVDLIAEVAIWVSPEYVKKMAGPIYPDKKRGPKADKGRIIDGIYIDDNTFANHAIKRAIGKGLRFENFFACHIWPETVYDERYYSLLPNLVLIPRGLAGLSDHYKEVIDVLKYRSFELYGWYPQEEQEPSKPAYYPANWNTNEYNVQGSSVLKESDEEYSVADEEYLEDREAIEVEKVKKRVHRWLKLEKRHQENSKILISFMKLLNHGSSVSKDELRKACADVDKFDGNFNQMKNFGRNNHGKVFEEIADGRIILWASVSTFVRNEYKKYFGDIKS